MRTEILLLGLALVLQVGPLNATELAAFADGPRCPAVMPGDPDDSVHFLYGRPMGTPETNDLVSRSIYELSSNDETKFADWVAYCLDMTRVNGPSRNRPSWKADPEIASAETLEPDDYDGAHAALGVDRGHQAPFASFRGHPDWRETRYLSNITPQKSDLNQGPWRCLEANVRELVMVGNVVYVVTGPFYERDMGRLPGADEPHIIPSGYWKIVAVGHSNDPSSVQAASFIFDQDTSRSCGNLSAHIVTIDEIELRSGLDLFSAMPDQYENALEVGKGIWPMVVTGSAVQPRSEPNMTTIVLVLGALIGLAVLVLLLRR